MKLHEKNFKTAGARDKNPNVSHADVLHQEKNTFS